MAFPGLGNAIDADNRFDAPGGRLICGFRRIICSSQDLNSDIEI
jgi:hypothetical protein